MSKKVSPERFPTMVKWLIQLLDFEDQVVITEGWMKLMPPHVFSGLKTLIKKTMAKDWIELTRRIPHLDNK